MSNAVAAKPAAAELGHAVTLMVRDRCLCLHVQRAARALARRFDDVFRPFDVTSGQFSLLMSLNRREPPTLGNVAADFRRTDDFAFRRYYDGLDRRPRDDRKLL